MKLKSYILFIFLAFFLSSTCKKNDPEYFPLNEDFKSYTYFKNGTYWIYADSIGNIDSCIVLNSKIVDQQDEETISKWYGEKGKKEIIAIVQTFFYDIKSNLYDTIYEMWGSSGCNTQGEICSDAYYGIKDGKRVFIFFWEPIIGGKKPYNKYYITEVSNILDSLLLNNKIYYNIIVIKQEFIVNKILKSKYINNHFFAKNYGIIKKELYINTDSLKIWNLIGYNIIQ